MTTRVGALTIIEFTLDFIFATQTLPPIRHVDTDNTLRFLLQDQDAAVQYLSMSLRQATEVMSDALT